jgi:hypothetical protein
MVRITLKTRPRRKKYRWAFCRIRGNLVSPLYFLWASETAHAGGEPQNDRY